MAISGVSIPHRYGKNEEQEAEKVRAYKVSIPHRYGKNTEAVVRVYTTMKFPFLIGTVRTFYEYFPKCFFVVSIPHRYGKN